MTIENRRSGKLTKGIVLFHDDATYNGHHEGSSPEIQTGSVGTSSLQSRFVHRDFCVFEHIRDISHRNEVNDVSSERFPNWTAVISK